MMRELQQFRDLQPYALSRADSVPGAGTEFHEGGGGVRVLAALA